MFRLYLLGVVLLFFYSFTQIDLGLALTRFPSLFTIQRSFQYIGYFNRPLSTLLYIGILVMLFGSYGGIMFLAMRGKVSRKTIWTYLFLTTLLLTFSYNAFSYDLFNYIFDAKILTFYQQNPYLHKALDFPGDPMLAFMHWTHRTYPYGPIWLALTIPVSFLGLHIFLFTFGLFKLVIVGFFLLAVYYLEKIAREVSHKQPLLPVVFFAFNPFVVIESVVSAHNDIVMMALALAGIYFLLKRRFWGAFVLIGLSVGVKYATGLLLPVVVSVFILLYMRVKIPWKYVWFTAIACMSLAVVAASQTSGNFQPWYLLYLMPFLALVIDVRGMFATGLMISTAALALYAPFFYYGNWDNDTKAIHMAIYITTGIALLFIGVISSLRTGKLRRKRV